MFTGAPAVPKAAFGSSSCCTTCAYGAKGTLAGRPNRSSQKPSAGPPDSAVKLAATAVRGAAAGPDSGSDPVPGAISGIRQSSGKARSPLRAPASSAIAASIAA